MNPLDSGSRDVLRAGQAGEGPTAADKERLRQKLTVAIAAGVTGPAIAAPAVVATKGWTSRAMLARVGLVSALVVGVTAVVVTRPSDAVEPPPPIAATPPAPAPDVTPLPEVEPPEPLPPPEQVEPTSEPVTVKKTVKRTRRPAASPEGVEPTAPPVAPPPLVPPAPEKPTPDELEAETQALKEVQLALRAKQPQRALALLDQQDRRFANGQLRQEREGARVLALCATDAAAGAAAFEAFRAAHPTSPMLARLKGACGP